MDFGARTKGVFFFQEPTELTLKSCSFFWKNIIVYESFISDIRDNPKLTEISKMLFENDVLKIVHTPDGLKNAMWDKVYHGLDEELRYLLKDYSERFVFTPEKPSDFEELVKKSTSMDENDSELKKLIDQIVRLNTYQQWLGPVFSDERFIDPNIPFDMKQILVEKMTQLVEMQIEHNKKVTSQGGYGFNWRNKMLMEQIHASSALFVEYNWIPYYQYKLGDRRFVDARSYLAGLDTIYPFMNKKKIESYSIDDILEIRKNRRWDTAMDRLTVICDNAKVAYSEEGFQKEITEEVMREMMDYLDEDLISKNDLVKELAKEGVFAAIGFIPLIGNVIPAIEGFGDPIVEYMRKKKKQQSLPFFINDLRKI